jgi:3-keto-5-aminohexanoate cleavage enzyme
MLKRNIKAEMKIYHHGMLREMKNFIDKGLIQKPYYVNFVMGMVYQGAV